MQTEVMTLICDVIILFILVMAAVSGYKNGLLSRLLRVLSVFIAVLIVYAFHAKVAAWLTDVGLTGKIAEAIQKGLTTEMLEPSASSSESGFLSSLLPGVLRLNLSENDTSAIYSALGVNSYVEYVAAYLARTVVNALSVLGLFLIAMALLRLLSKSLTVVNKLPLIGLANQILGAAGELIVAVLILQFIMMVLTALSTLHPVIPSLLNTIEGSYVGSILYKNNFFMKWILSVK